jgi:DNA repair protein RadC
MRISEWHPSERPREKVLARGVEELSDAELLALVIRNGARGATAVDLARALLEDFGGLPRLASRNVREIVHTRGMGLAKSVGVAAAFELGRRAAAGHGAGRSAVTSPGDVVRLYGPGLRHLKHEVFRVILLDSANHLLRDVTVSTGILNSSLVHPREVFQPAILEPAAGVILLHNHPSGNPEPSGEDIRITRQLADAGRILGIPVHDHVIIAGHESTSFAEKGLL